MRWRVGCTRRVTFRSIALLLNHSTSTLINLTTPINNPYNHHPHTKITPQHTLTLKTTSHTPPSLDHLALTFSASIHPCFHPPFNPIHTHTLSQSIFICHIHQPCPPRGTKRNQDTTTAPFTNTTSSPPSCPQHPDKIQATTMSHSLIQPHTHHLCPPIITAHHTTVTQSSPPSVKS